MSLPWLRLYTDFLDDPKVEMLAFEDQRHFVATLILKRAGLLDAHYSNAELRDRVIAKKLGLSVAAADEARRRLTELDLIDEQWQPIAWNRRQFESDSSTVRTRNWRAKHRETSQERHRDGVVTAQDTDTDTDTDTDSEKSKRGSGGDGATSAPAHAPPKRAKPATGLPEPYTLTPALVAYAVERLPNVDVSELLAGFVDHHRAKRTISSAWDATWRTWVRRAQGYGYPMLNPSESTASQIKFDANGRVIRAP